MKRKTSLVIGTRGSKLAMIQANAVAALLKAAGFTVTVQSIVTSGDRTKGSLATSGGKGLFVKELEEALAAKTIDLAVHSMKDIPGFIPRGFVIAAVTKRNDPRDVLVSMTAATLAKLPAGARVGTSSPRRRVQILADREDIDVVPMRGNVDTRLGKLKAGEAEGLVMAAAGLKRLGIPQVITQYLPIDRFVPAVGQGVLAIEMREGERDIGNIIQQACHDVPTALALRAERSFLRRAGGDCSTPLGGHATIAGDEVSLSGFMATPDGARAVRETLSGEFKAAEDIGKRLADQMLARLSGTSIGRRV